jgi:hypothetical protein
VAVAVGTLLEEQVVLAVAVTAAQMEI